jgi:hypothetical protein
MCQHFNFTPYPVGGEILTVLKGAQNTELAVGIVPHEIIIAYSNHLVAKGEVKRSTLARILAVHGVQVCAGNILSRRKCSHKLVEDGRGQGTQGVSAVEQHSLTLSSCGCLVDLDNIAARLIDRDAIQVDPESCEAVGRLCSRDDGTFDEVSRVLLDVDTAEDHGSWMKAVPC